MITPKNSLEKKKGKPAFCGEGDKGPSAQTKAEQQISRERKKGEKNVLAKKRKRKPQPALLGKRKTQRRFCIEERRCPRERKSGGGYQLAR